MRVCGSWLYNFYSSCTYLHVDMPETQTPTLPDVLTCKSSEAVGRDCTCTVSSCRTQSFAAAEIFGHGGVTKSSSACVTTCHI